jgi:hypothetical protein
LGRIGAQDGARQDPFQQPREGRQERQERERDHDVEASMEVRNRSGQDRLDVNQHRPDPGNERHRDRGADEPGREIAGRRTASCDIRAARTFEQRVDRRPDVRPDHQSDRGVQRQDSLGRKRHDEQSDGNARMRSPGHHDPD